MRYGQYEVVGRLHATAHALFREVRPIATARESIEDQGRLVAKVFEPAGVNVPPDYRDSDANRRLVDLFRAAAETQNTVANDIESSHWAPIRDSGTFRGGAFYITEFVEYAATDLLAAAGGSTPEELFAISHGVVEGLLELDRCLQRPHGNIKPGNILLKRSDRDPRNPWLVMLTDPASDAELQSSGKRTDDDLNELGKLLYQLVEGTEWRHRPGTEPPPTKAWKQLGHKGEQWRALCRDLLGLSPPTLRETSSRLEKLRPKPRVVIPIAASCCVMLLLAVGWLAYVQLGSPSQDSEQVVVNETDQDDDVQIDDPPGHRPEPGTDEAIAGYRTRAAWFAALIGEDREQIEKLLDSFRLEQLNERIKQLDEDISQANPENMPDDSLTALTGDIDELHADLIGQFVAMGQGYDKLPWQGANDEFQEAFGRIDGLRGQKANAATGGQLRNRLVTLHQLSQRRDEAVEAWDEELEPQLDELSRWANEHDENIISELRTTVDRELANVALDDLVKHLAEWRDLADQLDEATGHWDRIDVEYLRDSEWYKSAILARQIQREHLTRWSDAVEGGEYDLLADGENPLPDFDRRFEERKQQIDSHRERLAKLLDRAGEDDREMPPAPDLDEERAELPLWDGTRRTRDRLARGIARIEQIADESLNDLVVRIARIIGHECEMLSQTLAEGLPDLPDPVADHTTSLNEAWQRIVDERTEGELEERCAELRQQAGGLRRVADRIRDEVVPPAGAPPPDEMPDHMDRGDIDQFLYSKWEREVGAALAAIDPTDRPEWNPLIEAGRNYELWVTEVRDVLADYAQIEGQLLAAHDLREIEDNYRACADSEVITELCEEFDRINQLADAVQKLRRIDQFTIASIGDGQQLVHNWIADPDDSIMPVHRWSAWQKLGEATLMRNLLGWEEEAQTHVVTALNAITRIDRDRGESLQDEFRQQRQSRWQANVEAAYEIDWLNDAFDRMADFNVERDLLSGQLAFNYEMHKLLQKVRQHDADASNEPEWRTAIKEQAGSVLKSLEELDDAETGAETIERWRRTLTEIRDFEFVDREPDWANAGPAAAGWRRDPADDGAAVMRFTPPDHWRQEHGELLDEMLGEDFEIAFRRVAMSGGENRSATYLSTSEVSAGLFLAVAKILNIESTLDEDLLHHNPRGAKLWDWRDGQMNLRRYWLDNQSDVERRRDFSLPEPGPAFPMQNVSPAAALGVAQVLGCRLPTESEWRSAVRSAMDIHAHLFGDRIERLVRTVDEYNDPLVLNHVGGVNGVRDRSTADVFRDHSCENEADGDIHVMLDRIAEIDSEWFHPVDMAASEFTNLIGNVAEFVLADYFDRHKELPHAINDPARFVEQLREIVLPHGAQGDVHLRIIGGSIFWPKDSRLFCSLPYRYRYSTREARSTEVHRQVYPDVGFRLAFDSPVGESGRERFQRLVEQVDQREQPFLLATCP